ncbi:polysaccharide pyruvyl transferase family protein [Rhodopirellula sallentina]|uniref:Polysaccharide pyruvyl transferase CsaB n=1 Tax=Rhodopirellula sallentina SM41 TaxID=1263870 RepID=M5U9J1_9BACT|nr:polysaccharide pyruvyl transferase family protein [Rhodopirellula sallentina]EMI58107.1 polysaccharide pyruvyl transferase CsaB [Rhodopirellula sallentina SM41]
MNISKKLNRYHREAYRLDHFPPTWEALVSGKPRLAYFGFLGDRNLGDEMVYWAAKELFSDCVLIPVKRRSPIGIKLAASKPRRFFDGIVQGGGTLINENEWDTNRQELFDSGLPIYVHGSGVAGANPNPKWNVLSRNTHGGLRGPLSKGRLDELVKLPIVGDAAFALGIKAQRDPERKRSRVLINLGTHEHNRYPQSDLVESELVEFCRKLMDDGLEVVFLPFHGIDVQRANQLKEKLPSISVLNQPRTLKELQDCFDDALFALGERLHFVISAALFHCPFLSINYASKHRDFLKSVGLECLGADPGDCHAGKFTCAFDERESHPTQEFEGRLQPLQELQRTEANAFISAMKANVAK